VDERVVFGGQGGAELVEWGNAKRLERRVLGARNMHTNALIIIADAARARLFKLVKTDHPRAPVVLREVENLVHPEARLKEGERFSGSFPAAVGSSAARQGHTLNDHRGAQTAEELRRFAKAIAQSATIRIKEGQYNPLILVATHTLHSVLAYELTEAVPREVVIRCEIAELSELTPSELLGALEERGVFQP
jgi:hypothetical protein